MVDPPTFSIDPQMQRKRFTFFTTNTEDEFAECPEPGAKSGIVANSIQMLEKHYSAIESARDELAKKMRVYKYQLRVARTAIFVCTVFMVCYTMYTVALWYMILGGSCPEREGELSVAEQGEETELSVTAKFIEPAHLCLFINSALNVVIYGMMHRTVRAQMKKIVLFCRGQEGGST